MISTLALSVESFLKELCMLSPPAKECNGGISESAHFFGCFIILLWERASKFEGAAHLWKCK